MRASGSREIGAVDLLVIIYAIAQAWQLAPTGLLAVDARADDGTRRAAAIEAVRRILA